MNLESHLPFPANRLAGAAAQAGHSLIEHFGQEHAITNADEARHEPDRRREEAARVIASLPSSKADGVRLFE